MITARAELDHLIDTLGVEEVVHRLTCHEDLLEACKGVVTLAEYIGLGTNPTLREISRLAWAAIAKATETETKIAQGS